jgi:hypothetical protein
MRNVKETNCGFDNELLSYIYEDSSVESREQFEEHLAECTTCTDEFAAVSLARYSVYEWHKEEFVPLATPQIVIPYSTREVTPNVWDGLRSAFSFNWATPAFAAAGILLAIGITFYFVELSPTSSEVAANKVDTRVGDVVSGESPESVFAIKPADTIVPSRNSIPVANTPRTSVKPTRASASTKREIRSSPAKLNDAGKPATFAVDRNFRDLAPQDEDVEDSSLRLSDLFDAEDTRL